MGGSISKKTDGPQVLDPSSSQTGSSISNPTSSLYDGTSSFPQHHGGFEDDVMNNAADALDGQQTYHSHHQSEDQSVVEKSPAPVDVVIPTVFRWEHGGNQVYITGSFNHWNRRVPMHRSGNDFIYIQSLAKGKYAYKFIVDDEWRFAPDQATISDAAGNVNNCIDLTTFSPDDESSTPSNKRRDSLPGVYGRTLPDEDEYSKEPPLLPPHLRHIVLNSPPPGDEHDPLQLENPKQVTLTHLYCTAIVNGLMVQAISHRYRRKMTTTIFYSLSPSAEVWT